MESLPIACTLSAEALEERKATTLEQLFVGVQEMQPLRSGYRFRFDASDQILTNIFEMIAKERKCCRFLDFELKVHAAEGPVWLAISGPEGTKHFLESMLNKAAGTRVRKGMQELKTKAQDIRVDVQEKKNT